MELHFTDDEILRILLAHANAITPESYVFDEAEIIRYPALKIVVRKAAPYEAQ
jgi:hypothetical protein